MITIPLEPFYAWALVFLRTSFIIGFFPLFGEKFVPLRVRILMAAVVAIALTPVAPVTSAMFPSTVSGFLMLVFTEAMLGFGLGLIARVMFAIVQFSGQIAGEQMGFGIVNAIDPTGAHQISVIAEMLYVLSILVFLTSDMHHVFLAGISASFAILPPGEAALTADVAAFMVDLGTVLFSMSLQLAMPVIIIIFSINVSLGLIARGVPQINVFLESFPLRIIAGVSVVMLSLGFTASLWSNLFSQLDSMFTRLIGLMAG